MIQEHRQKMPHKDPDNISSLIELLKTSSSFQGALMAMIIALLRVTYYGERKPIKIGMETLICGFLSLGSAGLIDLIEALFLKEQLPETVLLTICSMVGFVGVTALREFMLKFLNKKAEQPPHNRYNPYNNDEDDYL